MAWLCTKDNTYRNSQMVVVTGPNWDLSIKLMKRLKAIFEPKLNIIFDDKETVLNLMVVLLNPSLVIILIHFVL